MKKFFVGFVCGAVLLAGVSVSAAEIKSILVGKKVEGTMIVTINGKVLAKEAAIINGTSYLPVRDIVDGLGGEVSSVKNRTIALSTEKRDSKVSNDLAEQARLEQEMLNKQWEKQNAILSLQNEIEQKNFEIAKISSEVEGIQNQINRIQQEIDNTEYFYRVGLPPQPYKESDQYQVKLGEIAEEEAEILRLQSELAVLQNELAELEAQQ